MDEKYYKKAKQKENEGSMLINPIKYPGNKVKILSQLIPELASEHKTIVDVFTGSGTVALNTDYELKVCNDISVQVMDLLKYFYKNNSKKVVNDVEKIIKDYGLTYSRIKPRGYYRIKKKEGFSKHNREGYLKLRHDYNRDKDVKKLFVLVLYGFNHYLRFNQKGEFNVPVGNRDFSTTTYNQTVSFVDGIKTHNIKFKNMDFRNKKLYEYDDAIFYFDPPYLITEAPYNINWSEKDEKGLLNILDELNRNNKKFVLSNVFKSNGKEHSLLIEWSKKYNVIEIERQYRNANYRRKNLSKTQEVLIKNF